MDTAVSPPQYSSTRPCVQSTWKRSSAKISSPEKACDDVNFKVRLRLDYCTTILRLRGKKEDRSCHGKDDDERSGSKHPVPVVMYYKGAVIRIRGRERGSSPQRGRAMAATPPPAAASTPGQPQSSASTGLGVGAMPAPAALVFCSFCHIRRADVRLPCGHTFHGRCFYVFPLTECPLCHSNCEREAGVMVLPPEPFSPGSQATLDLAAKDDESMRRMGRWGEHETRYAEHLVEDFEAGVLAQGDGAKLGAMLCNLLNCSATRLSKKLKVGKKYFYHVRDRPQGPQHVGAHFQRQRMLSDLEERFILFESQAVRGLATASLLSFKIQTEWRTGFIKYASTFRQSNLATYSGSPPAAVAAAISSPTETISYRSLLSSPSDRVPASPVSTSTPPAPLPPFPTAVYEVQQNAGDLNFSRFAPLFLLQHPNEGTESSPDSEGALSSQKRQGGGECAGSAQVAIFHNHQQLPEGLGIQTSLGLSSAAQTGGLPLLPDQYGEEQGLVHTSIQDVGWRESGFPGDLGVDYGTPAFAQLGGDISALGAANAAAMDSSNALDEIARLLDIHSDLPAFQRESRADRAAELTDGEESRWGGPLKEALMEWNEWPVSSGRATGTEHAIQTSEAEEQETSQGVRSHLFDGFFKGFLEQVPFEAVDVWVPINQDGQTTQTTLFHAGYYTSIPELHDFETYSTRFTFPVGDGLPGRVFHSHQCEWQEDVCLLGHEVFRRAEGAHKYGIRTTFGVPVVSQKGVTFVVVFYSRSVLRKNAALLSFIEQTVKQWNIDASVVSHT
jgi:hypothetical protein